MLSAGLYSILQKAGFKSDFVAGHSFGELTALWAAGVLSEQDYLFLVKSRGQAMAAPQDPDHDAGSMLAVKEEISKVEAVVKNFPQVAIANFNSPTQVVLAGPTAEIAKVRQALQEHGYAAILLPVSAAFHTPLIAFAQKSFAIATKAVNFKAPQIPVFSNVTGKQYPKEAPGIQKILESHLSNSVLFKQEIENIYAAGGTCFVEFGPRRILTNLVKDILGERPHLTVSLNPSTQKNSDRSLREAVIQLRVFGLSLKNLDPYQLQPALPTPENEKKKALTVHLNGINYKSAKTKNAFAQALQNGHQIKQPIPEFSETAPLLATLETATPTLPINDGNGHQKTAIVPTPIVTQKPQMNPATLTPQPAQESKMQPTPEKLSHNQRVLESLEHLLTEFQQNQSENLQLHGQYLNHQMEYAKTFFQLMQQQNSLFAQSNSDAETAKLKLVVMESLERSMMQFHTQQGETLRIHEQYLQEQIGYAQNFFQLIQQQYSQLISGEVATQSVAPIAKTVETPPVVATPVVKIVETSPVVATPVVKIVETSPVVTTPVVKTVETPPVVATPVVKIVETPAVVETPVVKIVETPPVVETPAAPTTTVPIASATDFTEIGKHLLEITSEKTGYPIEMLEMDMDMEADLGIDSIKRVEILGGLQELYPSLPKPNLEELAEKRTIGQVVEYLQSHASRTVSVEIAIHEVQQATEIAPVVSQEFTPVSAPISEIVAFSTEPETANVNDYADLGQTLLNITSEKTGYPVEMLEMEMDMEADLGIDSIKRVEILGAIQEMYPNLPKPNIEELGDLRTIGQIVDYLQQLAGGEKKKSQFEFDDKPIEEAEEDLDHNIQRRPAKLKFLPSPDYLDFSLPEGHISLITDDGSLTTSVVAQSLIDKGWKVVVLSFPQSLIANQATLPAGVERITLADLSEELLQHKLNAIATNIGAIGAFIHIHPIFQLTNSERISYLEQEKAIVKHIFFIAKHLKKSLTEAANYGRSCFCTVTRLDGAFGFEHKTNYGVIGAGLFGLTKTLRWEWPKVYSRAIDLSPTLDAQQSAQHIIAELHDSNLYISEVAYGSQGRVTLTSSVE